MNNILAVIASFILVQSASAHYSVIDDVPNNVYKAFSKSFPEGDVKKWEKNNGTLPDGNKYDALINMELWAVRRRDGRPRTCGRTLSHQESVVDDSSDVLFVADDPGIFGTAVIGIEHVDVERVFVG